MIQPTIFVSHGSPLLALSETPAHIFLEQLGRDLRTPRAILIASPHFPAQAPTLVADPQPAMIYDFVGFPAELNSIRYPAPGDPALAAEAADLIAKAGFPIQIAQNRGFDHGAWVPLSLMFPAAVVPIVQLSIQSRANAEYHLRLGRALESLHWRDVLVIGTGAMTHNLQEIMSGGLKPADAPAENWALAFSNWIADRAESGAIADLVDYSSLAAGASRAHPADDHLLSFFVALGAAGERAVGERIHTSIEYASLSMDAYRFT